MLNGLIASLVTMIIFVKLENAVRKKMCIRDSAITAHTPDCPVAAAELPEKGLYALQFHPEVLHTAEGTKMLSNFVYNVCGCKGDWRMDSFVETSIEAIREKVGSGRVLLSLIHILSQ